ncbi:MAG TPA: hypothetical protein DCS97_06900 [Planctomycetes bacterium]|nr:hypothetical protein [Planctomycetota bacterium]
MPVQTRRSTGDGMVDASVEVRPAIVVRVWSEEMINVRIFSDDVNDNLRSEWGTSLHYSQDDHRVGTWHWMPYQIQTAPKA